MKKFGESSKILLFLTGILNEGDNAEHAKAKKDAIYMDEAKQRTIQHQFDAYIKRLFGAR